MAGGQRSSIIVVWSYSGLKVRRRVIGGTLRTYIYIPVIPAFIRIGKALKINKYAKKEANMTSQQKQ